MKKYEEITSKDAIANYSASTEERRLNCTTSTITKYVACFEELFKALETDERTACFNCEYVHAKTHVFKHEVANVVDVSDGKHFVTLYAKEQGKRYVITFTKAFHDAFVEAFPKDKYTLNYDTQHALMFVPFDDVPNVVAKIQSVLRNAQKAKTEAKQDVKKDVKTEAKANVKTEAKQANVNGKARSVRVRKNTKK